MPLIASRTPWPLVGRHEELALVARELERSSSCGVIIAGAPGVGKTRLRSETLARLRREGWLTREVTATRAAATIPFGPLAPLLPEAASLHPLDVLRQSVRGLREERGARRLLVSVDDSQFLDAASAALLHQLASTQTAMLLLTARSGEILPDPILGLRREGAMGWIELQPLSRPEVEALLAQVLDGHIDAGTLHQLVRLSQGNVLFLRELVEVGLSSGALAERDASWRWEGELVAAQGPLDMIEERIRRLDAPQREMADAVALAEPMPLAVLEGLGSRALIRDLETAGMVTTERDRRRWMVRLAHPLYAEALRARLTPLRRRELLGRLADALETTSLGRGDDPSRVALLRLEADQPMPAATALTAARRMLGVSRYDTAERLARSAVESGGRCDAEIALAQALAGLRKPEEAQAILDRVSPERPEQLAELAMTSAGNLQYGLRRADRALQVLREAADRLGSHPVARELAVIRALFEFSAGKLPDTEALVGRVIEDPGAPVLARVGALGLRGLVLTFSGLPLQAITAVDRGVELLQCRPDLLGSRSNLLTTRWEALWFKGALADARRLADEVHAQFLEESLDPLRGYWTGLVGWGAFLGGQSRTAASWLEEGAAICHRYMVAGGHLVALEGLLAQAASLRGEVRRAQEALAAARSAVATPTTEMPWVDLCEAWVEWARGDGDPASTALRAARGWRTVGFRATEAWALHDAARLGDLSGMERLAWLAEGSEGDLIPAMAAHLRGFATADAPALEEVSVTFERMGFTLLAAEAAAEAAEVHRQAGRAGRARAPLLRSAALAAQCEGSRSPILDRLATGGALTERELQVARVAARGTSSAAIAVQLGLSVRTVENHLQQAYAKVGVRSRAELSAVLGRSEPVAAP